MSTNPADLVRLVPGFDFLQGLLKNAGAAVPGMGQWIAPTLNPEELEKRISELKTVHFWLEQNAKLLATTIQALEVQRMTLTTLQTMNLPLADLGEALKIKPAAERTEPVEHAKRPTPRARASSHKPKAAAASRPATPTVDPMQWWGALTQQFTELAAQAVKDSAADTAKKMAGTLVRQSVDTAAGALKKAAQVTAATAAATTGAVRPVRAAKSPKR